MLYEFDNIVFSKISIVLANIDTRLSGGSHENEGRVELQYNKEWIGLCDGSWDSNDASAVCHSLGYW